jgi:fructosamine-3-kinase
MCNAADLQTLIQHLAEQTGLAMQNPILHSVGGGDINHAYHLQASGLSWFIKLNSSGLLPMFAAEAAGLQALADTATLKTPKVICVGQYQQHAYLVLEFIQLKPLRAQSSRQLGTQYDRSIIG